MEFIEGGFIGYPKDNKDGAGDSETQSCYIDKCVETVLAEVSDSYDQVISEHGGVVSGFGLAFLDGGYRRPGAISRKRRRQDTGGCTVNV
jgi:hypothetical protein